MDAMQDRRKLIVMRHAKAGELPNGPDFERALRPRGKRDSAAAGRWLAARGLRPDLVLCSAARRTRQTWQHLSVTLLAGTPGRGPEFSAEERLYDADTEDVAELVRVTGGQYATVLYIGHNPAAAGLVALLTGTEPAFPTAAIAVIDVQGSWADLIPGSGDLAASWTPGEAAPAG
jgi:phosphohistidine phosphatase